MKRRMEILETLCRRKNDTVENLANEFGVSKRTIKYNIEQMNAWRECQTRWETALFPKDVPAVDE